MQAHSHAHARMEGTSLVLNRITSSPSTIFILHWYIMPRRSYWTLLGSVVPPPFPRQATTIVTVAVDHLVVVIHHPVRYEPTMDSLFEAFTKEKHHEEVTICSSMT